MSNILIPVDSSQHSEHCLDFYVQHIHKPGNKVYTLYVAEYYGDVGFLEGPTPGRVQELIEEDRKKAAQVEAHVNEVFQAHNISGTFTRLAGKDVWHTIIEYGKSIKADLIVIGSRGLGVIRRTIMGSVSDSVLHHSDVPVLVCKKPHSEHHH